MEAARLDLVWRHPPGAAQSRLVAVDTGRTVQEVVEEIRPTLEAAGVGVTVREEAADREEVTVNGAPLEEILVRVKEGHDYCHARSRREEMEARRHPLDEDERIAAGYTEFMLRKGLLLAVEGED
ncbi:MAG TPA: DUF2703 domain-containing protein [Methanoregulaceae archaeon]|nr:DUF2703 domain-containing protein [Methanoregulaceae archaeon]